MRRRWTLFARLAAVTAIGLFGTQLLLVALYLADRGEDDPGRGFAFPLPERAEAIVRLIEAAPDAGLVLDAVNSQELRAFVDDRPIAAFEAEPLRLPGVERAIARFAERLGDRPYAAFIDAPGGLAADEIRFGDRTLWSRHPLRLAVALSDGRTLVLETRGDLVSRVRGLPIGFVAGLLSLAGAVAVLLVLRHETRPIARLAAAMRAFGRTGAPQPVRAGGARELGELTAEFDRMQHRVAGLVRDRTVMLGALGHDLRTYLTRLRLRAAALPGGDALEPTLARMEEVVANGLILARGEDGIVPRDVLALPVAVAEAVTGRPDVTLGPLPEVEILFDAVDLRRLLGNLCDNALKFGTGCRIAARLDGARVRLEIDDDGPGIPPEEHAAAFEPFVRPGAARTLGSEGTGLGLAIVRLLAIRNGASVELRDSDAGGLQVVVAVERA